MSSTFRLKWKFHDVLFYSIRDEYKIVIGLKHFCVILRLTREQAWNSLVSQCFARYLHIDMVVEHTHNCNKKKKLVVLLGVCLVKNKICG